LNAAASMLTHPLKIMPVINDIAVSPEHFIYRNVNKFEKYKYTIKM